MNALILRDMGILLQLLNGCPTLPSLDSLPSLISSFSSSITTLYHLRVMIAPFVEDIILIDRVSALRYVNSIINMIY